MLRMTTVSETPSEVTLRVEGQVVSHWVSELEREIRRHLEVHRRVALDFQDVKFVDWNGIEMLKSLPSEAVEVVNAPPLIRDLLSEGDG